MLSEAAEMRIGERSMRSIALQVLATAVLLLHLGTGAADTGSMAHGHRGDNATSRHRFDAVAKWQAHFEDPARAAWQLPDQVVKALVDRRDLVIADVGSATEGAVIGADIEPGMVISLNDRARREGLDNLVSVLAGPEDPHLPRAADVIFFCDTVHHIDGRIAYFTRLKHSLRPGGRIAIVDFRLDSDRGPPHKLDPEQVKKEMRRAGYTLIASHDFLPDQYFLVFESRTQDVAPHAR